MPESWKVRKALSRRTVLSLGAALLFTACSNWASAGPNLVDLSVVDRATGQLLTPYQYGGKVYVAGRPGASYSLRVQNRRNGRVMVVVPVDGVNIITGQTASYTQTGYVLAAWSSYDLSGWRKSDTEIAAFQFASLGQSYAVKTGRPGNVSVIGMAVFQEKEISPPPSYNGPAIFGRNESASPSAEAGKATSGSLASGAGPAAPSPSMRAQADNGSAGASAESRARENDSSNRIAPTQPSEKTRNRARTTRVVGLQSYGVRTSYVESGKRQGSAIRPVRKPGGHGRDQLVCRKDTSAFPEEPGFGRVCSGPAEWSVSGRAVRSVGRPR